eukprot:TRINITY_DN3645_c0_g1_i1.p1 TRINITY_DN3645_c0_g1~~TRINITY_DN3645_c0_g1_i1.p1  ORF type:complete len:929 (-),score=269.44 TRINITY_DN3645_c0_g1_i1:70-2856(-)
MSKKNSYFVDPQLKFQVGNVIKELEGSDPTLSEKTNNFIINDVLAMLKTKYPAYSRKKEGPLKDSVVKAMAIVRPEKGSTTVLSDDSIDDDNEKVDLVQVPSTNILNSGLRSAYKTKNENATKQAPNTPVGKPLYNAVTPPPSNNNNSNNGNNNPKPSTPTLKPLYNAVTPLPLNNNSNNNTKTNTNTNNNNNNNNNTTNESDGTNGFKLNSSTPIVISPPGSPRQTQSTPSTPFVGFSDNKKKRPSDTTTPTTPNENTKPQKKKKKNQLQTGLPGQRPGQYLLNGNSGENNNNNQNFTPTSSIPKLCFSDIGGIESIIQDITEQVEWPLKHPEIYQHLNVDPPRGILLHGPPGCGKTMLANAIAGELQVPFFSISAPEVVSGMSGESEAKLRSLFKAAQSEEKAIIFIDEIDAITPKRENAQREMERRIVAQLLTCMDGLSSKEDDEDNPQGTVIVLGATNRPDALDPALRRAGRFDREISIGVPDQAARSRILQVLCGKMRLEGDFDFMRIASVTPGYVGADLSALAKEAAVIAINRIFKNLFTLNEISKEKADPHFSMSEDLSNRIAVARHLRKNDTPLTPAQLAPLSITMNDFMLATKKVQPSAKREGFATIPNVTWDDVGALHKIREELSRSILFPIRYPDLYKKAGITAPAGVLLYGPPGCGKTMLAKAIANECQANFISIKGPELLNKYVGESERAVRQVFARAQNSAPCIIFFDELDALAPKRGNDGNQASERVVNMLLTELDGLDRRQDVFVIAATNRPDIIDPAMLRPGRLDKLLYVPLPSPEERVEILRTITAKIPLSKTLDLSVIGRGQQCNRFSGADLSALVKETSMFALHESLKAEFLKQNPGDQGSSSSSNNIMNPDKFSHLSSATPLSADFCIEKLHFDEAFKKLRPSVSEKSEKMFARIRDRIKSPLDSKK